MNQHKYQVNFKNVLLLVTSLTTTIIYSRVAFANSQPEITVDRKIDNSRRLDASSQKVAPGLAANTLEQKLPATQNQIAQASDVTGNWGEPFIKALVEKGIIAGYPDGTFRPDQPVTRAEFAALLNKAFDLEPTRESRAFREVAP